MELVEYSKVPLVYFPDNVGPEDLELINRAYRKENRQGLFLSLQAPLKPLGLDGVIDLFSSLMQPFSAPSATGNAGQLCTGWILHYAQSYPQTGLPGT